MSTATKQKLFRGPTRAIYVLYEPSAKALLAVPEAGSVSLLEVHSLRWRSPGGHRYCVVYF